MSEGSADVLDRTALSAAVKAEALRLGFTLAGIAPASSPTGFSHLQEWIARGHAGEMEYIPRRADAYEHPRHVLPQVRSIVMLAANYRTADPPSTSAGEGRVSRYAWGESDYHDVLRARLKQLAAFLHTHRPDCRTRGVVDTAPLLERDFARLSGLGWFGKNTMLINKYEGSWLFLSALLTEAELEADQPHETAHCGTCTRCLDACPTDAFTGPYVLDARRCISYLTIELRNQPIPLDLRDGLQDWVFGCDVCQEVCPWNHKPRYSDEPAFQPLPDRFPVDARELVQMDAATFATRFGKTPLARPGRAGILRNAAIVLGNSGDLGSVPALSRALHDEEPLVRGAAAWALGKLGGEDAQRALQTRVSVEDNARVRDELSAAIHEGNSAAGERGQGE